MEHRKVLRVQIRPIPAKHTGGSKREGDASGPVELSDGGEARTVQEAPALDTLARLLSQRNVELLKLINRTQPGSVAELARLSGRPKASLMLTLRRMESFGIIAFEEAENRRKVPRVACERLLLDVALGGERPREDT